MCSLVGASWSSTGARRLHFVVNNEPGDSDMELGAVWAAGAVRARARQLGMKTAWDNAPGTHGQVMQSGHASFGLFKAGVLSAFGLGSAAAMSR